MLMVHVDIQLQLCLIWKQVLDEISWRLAPQFLAKGETEKNSQKCFSNGRCSISKIRIWKNSCGSDNLTQSFNFNRSFIILCWKLPLDVWLCSLWQKLQSRQKGRKNSWTRSHRSTLIMRKL